MKKTLFVLAMLFTVVAAWAQGSHTVYVCQSNGFTTVENSDSITFTKPTGQMHEFVDLGLSVKWATCNIGSLHPEGLGVKFAWGETESKSEYDMENYKYYVRTEYEEDEYGYSHYNYIMNKYNDVDGKDVLDPSDDAATVNWGGSWRMPTRAELEELHDNCSVNETMLNDVPVIKLTGPNGNSIFFPYSKNDYYYYWTGSLYGNGIYNYDYAYGFCIYYSNKEVKFGRSNEVARPNVRYIRPILP